MAPITMGITKRAIMFGIILPACIVLQLHHLAIPKPNTITPLAKWQYSPNQPSQHPQHIGSPPNPLRSHEMDCQIRRSITPCTACQPVTMASQPNPKYNTPAKIINASDNKINCIKSVKITDTIPPIMYTLVPAPTIPSCIQLRATLLDPSQKQPIQKWPLLLKKGPYLIPLRVPIRLHQPLEPIVQTVAHKTLEWLTPLSDEGAPQ